MADYMPIVGIYVLHVISLLTIGSVFEITDYWYCKGGKT